VASESLILRVRDALAGRRDVAEKRMFGGVAFLLSGNMLVGVWKGSLAVRIGRDAYEAALGQEHVREFDGAGKPMRGWVLVEPEGLESDRQLAEWIERAARFVETLPAKG
jgi:TfoX/Sxy family transcriptional regulator of competence genes